MVVTAFFVDTKPPEMVADMSDPDYTTMSPSEMLEALGDDASKWAAAFCQTALKLGHNGIDEGWMIGWFANAIEHSYWVRQSRSCKSPETVSFV